MGKNDLVVKDLKLQQTLSLLFCASGCPQATGAATALLWLRLPTSNRHEVHVGSLQLSMRIDPVL